MAAETIKYFGGQTLDNSEMVTEKADTAEQNAKDYADGKFVTTAAHAADLDKKADKTYVDNTFIPTVDKLSASDSMTAAANANKVPTADAVVHYVSDKTKDVVDETALADYVKKADVTGTVTTDTDKVPSDAAVKAAIAFAGVKVGEVMDWFDVQEVTRNTVSDDPFNYTLGDEVRSVEPVSTALTLLIAQNVPDGWRAMNGLAELEADDYPELAAALPGNVTNTKHIWIPYMPHKIIKVNY